MQPKSKPWYRQFWPWFLILLPASVVVGGLTTVFIAVNNADTTVVDNYYREGLAINRTLDQEARARELGLRAEVTFDLMTGEALLVMTGDLAFPEQLQLQLLHPTDQRKDRTLTLRQIGSGRYRADLSEVPVYRYYLRIEPVTGKAWRLNGELDFSLGLKTVLSADG